MVRNSDFAVREDAAKLAQRIDRINSRFIELNDPFKILRLTQGEANKLVRSYTSSVRTAMLNFFAGAPIDRSVKQAEQDFRKAMRGIKLLPNNEERVAKAVKQQFTQVVDFVVGDMKGRQLTKINQFRLMSNSVARTAKVLIAEATELFKTGSRVFRVEDVESNWNIMQRRYGQYDTVLFRNGNKFPLRAYVDMRTTTAANEAHRVATSIEASINQIYTGKISRHNSQDSCRLHEGEVVFFSEAAKEAFRAEFPGSRAGNLRTVQQLESDPTHIFEPNCKHVITPVALQFMDDRFRDRAVEESPLNKIPPKINEKKFKESINAA